MKGILVLRLSSMGDVLLTLPVIKGVLSNNKDLQLIFVTRIKFVPYFTGIDRLIVIPFDPDGPHKGLPGLLRLFREIRRYPFSRVVDLHGILRTWLLDALFMFTGCRVSRVRKFRKIRRKILKHKRLILSVPHTVIRYLDAFEKAGVTGKISGNVFPPSNDPGSFGRIDQDVKRIGIAPVSKHLTKNWGLQNISDLISLLRLQYPIEIHLFGGSDDHPALNSLAGPDVFNHAGVISPLDEISLIQTLDVFISMDSANMHLASLTGIATVSIWGATDPRLGFAPMNQPDDYTIQTDPAVVTCRPCSVYGEIPCIRTDAPMICMNSIKPDQVLNKITAILRQTDQN